MQQSALGAPPAGGTGTCVLGCAGLSETFGGAKPIEFQMELREETAWTSQNGIELAFPWRAAIEVRDAGDAVEIWFTGGVVLARNRGFSSLDHRAQFIARAQALVIPQQRQ